MEGSSGPSELRVGGARPRPVAPAGRCLHFACLQDGRDSGGAELEVQRPTTEGDPTFFYYRVTPAGTTELYLDATRDIYSQGGWHFSVCENPSSVLQTDC